MPGRRDVWRQRFGTSFEARRWLSLDPCGWVGVTVSVAVHLYALIVLAWKCLRHSVAAQLIYGAVYAPVALLALASLWKASATDPGAVPMGARPLATVVRRAGSGELVSASAASSRRRDRAVRRCHKCGDNYKPARAHHDSVTGRCIVKFDHFCPWVNNSIGALNHKFFCLFLLYTALSCMVSLLLIVMRLVHCGYYTTDDDGGEHLRGDDDPSATSAAAANDFSENTTTTGDRILLSSLPQQQQQQHHYLYDECKDLYSNHWFTGLAICSLVFLIFSSAMGCEQLEAIETGRGKIARMKQQSAGGGGTTEYSTVTTEFNEMFGGDSPHPAWHWFLPVAIPFPRGMRQVVLGYEVSADDETGVVYQEQTAAADEQRHREEDSLLHHAEAGQAASPPPSPESDKSIAVVSADKNGANSTAAAAAAATAASTATDVRRSLYTGRPVDPLPLSRRSNSRSRSSSSSAATNNGDDGDGGGITLVDRTKARLA